MKICLKPDVRCLLISVTGKTFTWEDYYDIHQKFWENRETHVSATTITEDELLLMKEESKKLGITTNSYIVAKLLKK